jgi:peptidoglycan/xylan/chitin deacetylase (PgdA/CDA1 family)
LVQQKPYLSSEQIRGMIRDGFALGGHSIDHPFYGDLTLAEQLRQTRVSGEFLQQEFGVNYRAFAFPHSDSGVTRDFFERSYGDGSLEISFGTSGLVRDPWPRHFQRFSMEKTAASPKTILAFQCARRASKNWLGATVVCGETVRVFSK